MTFELIGTLIEIGQTSTYSKGFRKREFILETQKQNTVQPTQFVLTQDKCEMIDSFSLGDTIKVSFDISSRAWTDPKSGITKYFITLEALMLYAITRYSDSTFTNDSTDDDLLIYKELGLSSDQIS